jgi:cytidylate kinase
MYMIEMNRSSNILPGRSDRMKREFLITIDGPAGSGKSTASRMLAERLHYLYLDTGALYRALAYLALQKGISSADHAGVKELCRCVDIRFRHIGGHMRIFADGEDVTGKIRTEPVGLLASALSALPEVRSFLFDLQREFGKKGGVVAEGRDMGTIVFPDADLKFFLDADLEERCRRRYLDSARSGQKVDYTDLKKDMLMRDRQDRERSIAPLKVPEGAVHIDSTHLGIEAMVEAMLDVVARR